MEEGEEDEPETLWLPVSFRLPAPQTRRLRDPRKTLVVGGLVRIYICVCDYTILFHFAPQALFDLALRGLRRNAADGLLASARLLQLRIHPARAHELLMCTFLHDATIAHDRNRVRALDGAETVGNHQSGALLEGLQVVQAVQKRGVVVGQK